jgi:hypothetical protein
LIDAATSELLIDGTWLDPRVTKVDRKNRPPPDALIAPISPAASAPVAP